jgi:hypothetical protein
VARIAFVLDYEEGHLLPTFKLARQLQERGHSVSYLGLADSGPFVRQQGFELVPILPQVFPEGSALRLRREEIFRAGIVGEEPVDRDVETYGRYLGAMAQGKGLDGPVAQVRPDLFILNSFLTLNALVRHFRYALPVVFLTPYLRTEPREEGAASLEGTLSRLRSGAVPFFDLVLSKVPSARRLRDVTDRLLRMPELIQCPRELDLPREGVAEEPEVLHRSRGRPEPARKRGIPLGQDRSGEEAALRVAGKPEPLGRAGGCGEFPAGGSRGSLAPAGVATRPGDWRLGRGRGPAAPGERRGPCRGCLRFLCWSGRR